jgi:hypothetical protein
MIVPSRSFLILFVCLFVAGCDPAAQRGIDIHLSQTPAAKEQVLELVRTTMRTNGFHLVDHTTNDSGDALVTFQRSLDSERGREITVRCSVIDQPENNLLKIRVVEWITPTLSPETLSLVKELQTRLNSLDAVASIELGR